MRDNPFALQDRIVLITGGGSGLGLGMAEAIISAGGRPVITGRNRDKLEQACRRLGDGAVCYVHDVTGLDTIPQLIRQVEQEQGPIYGLINNAGVHLKKPAIETEDSELLAVLDTHLRGGFAMTRECAKKMLGRGEGSIIFICSMASVFGLPGTVAYTAAKSAMKGIVRTLAVELSPMGIRVNSIAPGWIESEMLRQAFAGDPGREKHILKRMPMGKIGDPKDIGNAAVFLCSPAAAYITGIELPVDGGVSIGF